MAVHRMTAPHVVRMGEGRQVARALERVALDNVELLNGYLQIMDAVIFDYSQAMRRPHGSARRWGR